LSIDWRWSTCGAADCRNAANSLTIKRSFDKLG
jgi:hypothetical protein